jgi:antitoxin component of RelBE/YafQ-DinJ toxin-antitoxin module
MTTILTARFDEKRLQKVSQIQADTGLTVSQLFRRLIDVAEVKPVEMVVNLPTQITQLPTGTTPEQI